MRSRSGIGGVAGAAIAAGPLIGGWVTTEFSWRYVFAGETVIVAVILLVRRRLKRSPAAEHRPTLDVVGVAMSALGLGLAVFGILKSSEWGLIEPRGALTIGGQEITPFGFSSVPFFILAGIGCLAAFAMWEERREREGRDTLLDRSLLRIEHLRAGLLTLTMQQLVLLGTFFVLPVYLQVVLGLDAFETGKRLFPMSVTMFLAAMAGPKLAAGSAPKRVAHAGLLALVVASVVLLGDDRRRARRDGVRARARALRDRRRPAALAAGERDHVVGRSRQDERGRRPAGDRAEPRRLARHGSDRRRADRGADQRLRLEGRAEPRRAATGPRARHRAGAEGRARCPGGGRRTGRARRGRRRRASQGDRRRLRRRPAPGTQAGHRRRRARGAALAVVHSAAPRAASGERDAVGTARA